MFSSFLLVCVLLAPPKRSSAHHARTTRRARTHTNTQVSDWLQDRWQAAQDMSGTPIQGPGLARRRPLFMPARVGPYVHWPMCACARIRKLEIETVGARPGPNDPGMVCLCVCARARACVCRDALAGGGPGAASLSHQVPADAPSPCARAPWAVVPRA